MLPPHALSGASLSSCADAERLGEVTDPGRRVAGAHAASPQRKAEDSSESPEDEQMVISFLSSFMQGMGGGGENIGKK